jgi:hypothetical protein
VRHGMPFFVLAVTGDSTSAVLHILTWSGLSQVLKAVRLSGKKKLNPLKA